MSSGYPATKEFRLFLLSVAKQLKGEESDTLCWLNGLPVQLKGTSPLTVLQEMEAWDLFSASKPERLAKILRDINRIDLAKKVTDYAKTRSSKRKRKVIAQSEDHQTTLIANLKVALIHTEITIAQLERVQETLLLEVHQSICYIRKIEELIRDAKGDAESIQRRLEEATTLSQADSPSPRTSGDGEIHPLNISKGACKPMPPVPPPKPQQQSQSLPVSSNADVVYDQPEAGIGGAQWNVNTEHHYSPAPLTTEVPKSQLVTGKSAKPPAPLPKPKDRTPPSPQLPRTQPQKQKEIISNHGLQSPPPSRIPKPRTQSPIPTQKESTVHGLDYANYPQSSDFSGGSDYSGTGDSGFAEATSLLRRPLSKPHDKNEPEAIAYYKSLDREAVDDIIYDQPMKNS